MEPIPKLDARVRLFNDQSGKLTVLLALVDLMIADAFVIKGIRILGKKGDEPFVVFPAEKGKGVSADRWFDIAHPVTLEARTAAINTILAKYNELAAQVKL